MSRKFKISLISFITATIFSLANVSPVLAASQLQGGDFFQISNNTRQTNWADPITAESGQIVEFRVTAKNIGDAPAERVRIWGSITGGVTLGPSNTHVITARIQNASFGGVALTDTATINVTGQPEGLRYLPGHARINGVTNMFNCSNTCPLSDDVVNGIDVGDIAPGQFVEVTFKATLTATPVATPTPTPTPSLTPSPSPTVPPPPPAGTTINNTNNNSNSNTNNNNININNSATANATTTAPAPVVLGISAPATLPKTGLPALAWLGMVLTPIGLGLKRFMKGSEIDFAESANFIAEKRALDKMA